MGNESSKESSSPEPEAKESSLSSQLKDRLHLRGIRRRLHLVRHGGGSGSSTMRKLLDADRFAGIALLTILHAEMKFKDKWLACVSFGEQTFRTQISDHTEKPIWNSVSTLRGNQHVLFSLIFLLFFFFFFSQLNVLGETKLICACIYDENLFFPPKLFCFCNFGLKLRLLVHLSHVFILSGTLQ